MAHKSKRKANSAFMKAVKKELKCSDELREFTGEKKISRPALTKFIWKHVKKKHLQTPEQGQIIRVDSKLQPIIDKKLIAKKRVVTMRGKKIKIPAGHIFFTELAGQFNRHLEG